MLTAIAALTGLATLFGFVLGYAAVRFRVEGDPLAERLDAVLPQTQCGQCGFAGCRPYAEALAKGEAPIDRCAPGGQPGIVAIAAVLGVEPVAAANDGEPEKLHAVIHENGCIGCTACIRACPVDAILGSAKHVHTVIAAECTGCGLCTEPCPVGAIDLIPVEVTPATWKWSVPAALPTLRTAA